MANFKVETMKGDAVLKSTEIQSNSDVQAAKSAAARPVEPGRARQWRVATGDPYRQRQDQRVSVCVNLRR